MDTIAGNVVQGLTSFAHEEFRLLWNVKHDVERMRNTVLAVRATLLDAEQKANTNHQLSLWLARLRDVLYDADDLLDDFSTQALRRQAMTPNKVAKEVRIFFSKSNQLVYNLKMAHRLRELRERLDEIDDNKNRFQLIDQPLKPLPILEERKQTYSFVQGDTIIGREEEKDSILRYLLEPTMKSCLSVIPIVGFGGLGKTALAQLVCNSKRVQGYFELICWVCVSDEFDVKQIAQKISKQGGPKEMEEVQQDLRKSVLQGKKFLVVLDDVWNEDVQHWNQLKSLLSNGKEGSMIIVTTLSEKVGRMMGTHKLIILQGLDDQRSWDLFCRMAFVGGGEPNKELLAIGKEVVKKCGGVPLAIRAVGSLVYEKMLEGITDLSYLRNCELWNVDKTLEDRVFTVLKLSYDHLPSPMKNCVAFCSLFPKGFLFEKHTLIQMWVAEGFTQSSSSKRRSEEDVGNEYFMNLLSRCFFQDVVRDQYDNIVQCKMHDLIHDLAQFVAKDEYLVIREETEERTIDTIRHFSYVVSKQLWEVPTFFLKFEKLRTILLSVEIGRVDSSVFDLIVLKLKCLRVLKLNKLKISEIPKSIGKLKHLRFLDLSCNWIEVVSEAVTELHNLQTLDLSDNPDLQQLPIGISKLVSLRHLHLTNCWKLEWMPSGLMRLACLQTLTDFAVADPKMQKRRKIARISELGELNNLRGTLRITWLSHLRSNPEEAESANLKEKKHLQQISLIWDTFHIFNEPPNPEDSADELILERLRPHHSIKALMIRGFCGERLPDWIGNLLQLQHLVLLDCNYLKSIPEGLGNLTSLRTFTTEGCPLLLSRQKFGHIPEMGRTSLVESGMWW